MKKIRLVLDSPYYSLPTHVTMKMMSAFPKKVKLVSTSHKVIMTLMNKSLLGPKIMILMSCTNSPCPI